MESPQPGDGQGPPEPAVPWWAGLDADHVDLAEDGGAVAVDLGPAEADEARAVRVVRHEKALEVHPVGGEPLVELAERPPDPCSGCSAKVRLLVSTQDASSCPGTKARVASGRVAATTSSGRGNGTRIWSRSRSGTNPSAAARSSSAGPACITHRWRATDAGASCDGPAQQRRVHPGPGCGRVDHHVDHRGAVATGGEDGAAGELGAGSARPAPRSAWRAKTMRSPSGARTFPVAASNCGSGRAGCR